MKLLINFAAFQAGWFSCVLGAAHGIPLLGPVVVLGVILLHLSLARQPGSELKIIFLAAVMGAVADSLLLASGWVAYPNGAWLAGMAPYWIISMWALFATTLNESMVWLRGRPVLAALMGAVGGPLSYLAGQKLGAITFIQTGPALLALAALWAFAMPMLSGLASRLVADSKQELLPYITKDTRVGDHV